MAGKITFRHPVNLTTEIRVRPLRPETVTAIAEALGRTLTQAEAQRIGESVDCWRWARDRAEAAVSPADVRATLGALAAYTGDVRQQFALADLTTRALVNSVLLIELQVRMPVLLEPDSDQIREAATIALADFGKHRTGPCITWLHEIASDSLRIWKWLDGRPSKPGATPANRSRITRFAIALFAEAGIHKSPSQIAKLQRAAMRPAK